MACEVSGPRGATSAVRAESDPGHGFRQMTTRIAGEQRMTILIAIVCSIVGAAVWEGTTKLRTFRRERRGRLAGWWWQVTYPPGDGAMVGRPWSVELASVHHFRNDFTCQWWRVYRDPLVHHSGDPDPGYDRRWGADGRYADGVVNGHYWGESGDAGDGVFQLRNIGLATRITRHLYRVNRRV